MPQKTFVISWDQPDDENWFNAYNAKIALEAYCENTKFHVTEISEKDSIKDLGFSASDYNDAD